MALFLYGAGALLFGLSAMTALAGGVREAALVESMLALLCAGLFYGRWRTRRRAAVDQAAGQQRAQKVLDEMNAGAMPIMTASKVLVRAGEVVHFAAPAELLKMQTTGYAAGTAGVSVRVAKGVTLRSGGIKGGAVKQLQAIAAGELALLDKRLVFGGDMKSFEVPYAKLTHIEKMADGMIVHAGEAVHMVRLRTAAYDVHIAHAVLDRLLAVA